MRGAGNFHRLRKYRRKKDASVSPRWGRIAMLYWRYHLRVYGPIGNLWDMDFLVNGEG
jgi:hypothetical protein